MPCRFASSGTVATSRSASRAILALNVASNFLRDLVISVLHRLRQSRTLHTLTFGPISGVHFTHVFRVTPESGHRSEQLACLKRANSGRTPFTLRCVAAWDLLAASTGIEGGRYEPR